MHLGNEMLDLISGETDLALRIGTLPDSNLIARKLGSLRTQVFASPAYIQRHGEPRHPDELQYHRTLAVRKQHQSQNNRFVWSLAEDGGQMQEFAVNPLMVANDASALNSMLVAGEGLMLSSDVMAKPFIESGMLRRVLAGWTGPDYDFSAVFAGGGMVSPKVRAFVDFLVEKLNLDANYMLLQCPNAKHLVDREPAYCQRGLELPELRVLEALSA